MSKVRLGKSPEGPKSFSEIAQKMKVMETILCKKCGADTGIFLQTHLKIPMKNPKCPYCGCSVEKI
jgi:hypothetical protein